MHFSVRQRRVCELPACSLRAARRTCTSVGKGKVRQSYESGVKASIAVIACKGLIVGACSFPGNPYDGDTLTENRSRHVGCCRM